MGKLERYCSRRRIQYRITINSKNHEYTARQRYSDLPPAVVGRTTGPRFKYIKVSFILNFRSSLIHKFTPQNDTPAVLIVT